MSVNAPPASPLKRRIPWLVGLFTGYVRRFLRRHFHAVRLARRGARPLLPDGPVVVAMSHPSWWDPMVGIALMDRLGNRVHVAPIEARALGRYRFFERLGFFGIEPGTRAGYRRLLQVGDEVLSRKDAALWITPAGRFADVRRRPLALRPGVGHLARRLRGGAILPVALEYTFWSERLPEALVRFGEPIPVADGTTRSAEDWTARIEEALTHAQDHLARDAMSRDPGAFETILSGLHGGGGTTWIYDLWRGLRARLGGRRHSRDHASVLEARAEHEGGGA